MRGYRLATWLSAGLTASAGALAAPPSGAPGVPRQLRVGFVAEAGTRPGRDNVIALEYLGFVEAVRKLGVQGRVIQVAPNQDSTGALAFLARQKYDLIVMGVADADALDAVALDYPHSRFFIPDGPRSILKHRPENVQTALFRAGEAGYLAGYLAALMERRRPGKDVISSVGGYKFSGVDRWIVGYRAGARKADPGITALNSYTNDFSNPTKCKTAALSQIARGSGVVFQVAGRCGLGTLAAAREKGVWGIGVDVDESYLGPQILTSAEIRPDRAVLVAIQQLAEGSFTTGGETLFDLRNGGVELGKISPKVPRAFVRQLERVRRAIIAGTIKVPSVT
jgi:basic membrane protein A